MPEIREVSPIRKVGLKIGSHSHIKGLGLDEKGKARPIADGLVGQLEAREAAGIIVNLVKEGKMGGKGVLIIGPPSTGKTAIALAIAKELGEDTPFTAINASEIYSMEIKKAEILTQALRKSIGIRIKQTRNVYEGAIKEIKFRVVKSSWSPYAGTPREATLTLKTKDEEKTINVGEEIASQLAGLRARKGDVIWIDADTGEVHKVGRTKGIEGAKEFDIEGERIIEIPSGPVRKTKDMVFTVTLHDLDLSASMQNIQFQVLFGLFTERQINDEIRREVDKSVRKMVGEGKGELVTGVLFIDEANMLDMEAFSFLNRALESDLSPLVILATNRGITKIRGSDLESPHGMPLDLLDRVLIIRTTLYSEEELREILKIRAEELDVELTKDGLESLTKVAKESGLRYAVSIMEPALTFAKRAGRQAVTSSDVEAVRNLFLDVKRSTEYVSKFESYMLK